MRMKQAYIENNKLGDPASVDSQLNENSNKLKKLQLEAEKFEKYINEINMAKPPSNNGKLNGSQNNQANRSSISEDSLSRSASDSSVSHPQAMQIKSNSSLNNGLVKQQPIFKTMNNSSSNNNVNNFKSTLNAHLNGNSTIISSASSNAGSSNSPDIG